MKTTVNVAVTLFMLIARGCVGKCKQREAGRKAVAYSAVLHKASGMGLCFEKETSSAVDWDGSPSLLFLPRV